MKLAALFASRQAVEPPKPPPLEPTTPAAFGYRFPVRLDFDPTKLPERTRVAWGHIDRWRKLKSVSKQPDIAAMVAEPRFTLRMFRIFNIGVGVARAQALVGDPSGVLELAGVARKLVAKANTGYGPYVAELGDGLQPANLNRSREQVGVRRYNTWTHGDDWLGFAGTDADHLDRCLSMGVIAGLYELLEGCAHVHADVAAAAAEVRELLCVDLAVRCAMWGRVNGGTIAKSGSPLRHAVTGFAYACRVIGERLSADPKLLGRAQALGAKHDTTVYAADFLKAYDDMGS